MEAHYWTRSGRLLVKMTGETQKDVFRQLAVAEEIFDAEDRCGCCASTNIQFRVRTVENFDHYELACCACDARFEFGQHKNGQTLFPKRRDEAGQALPNGGWKVWRTTT
jgi:hypothetical protein